MQVINMQEIKKIYILNSGVKSGYQLLLYEYTLFIHIGNNYTFYIMKYIIQAAMHKNESVNLLLALLLIRSISSIGSIKLQMCCFKSNCFHATF